MPASNETTFTIFLKTIADATGLTDLKNSVGGLQSSFATLKTALEVIGLGLSIRQLDEYGKKALEVREQQAAFTLQVLRSKDGSAALVDELNNLNRELADTTGTSEQTSRAIERQLLLFGATREQVVALTKGIIDFAAARNVQPDQLAFVISRALAGEDIMLNRLGLHLDKEKTHAEQVQQLTAQLGKAGGTAAAIEEASGGMGKLEVQTERAQIAIGNLVNIVKVPFMTALTGQIGGVKTKVDQLTDSTDTWGFKFAVAAAAAGHAVANIGNAFSALYNMAKAIANFIELLMVAAVASVTNGVEKLVNAAIDKLKGLVSAASTAASALSSGLINIDTAAVDSKLDALKTKFGATTGAIKTDAAYTAEQIDKSFQDALKRLNDAADNMGPSIFDPNKFVFTPEFIAKIKKQYEALFADLKTRLAATAKPGSGVIDGSDQANNEKAATDALSNAKFRLTAAQQSYELALEKTKALEDAGAISSDQANQQRRNAIQDYIAKLQQIRDSLPGTIAALDKMGKTEGANELRTELGKADIALIKLKTDLSNTTFLGQFRSQIRQLASEWSNLGKQLGTFVAQQFQNLAQTGGQAIAGLLFRTGNLKQSILQLGQQFVASLAQMLIQWVISQTVMKAFLSAMRTEQTTEATTQGAIIDAAMKPAAIDASIATYGAAATEGAAAYAIAFASAMATKVAGFLGGGPTGGREGQFAGIVHGEEFVVRAPAVRRVGLGILNAINSGALSFARPSYLGGGFVGPGGGGIVAGRGIDPNDLKIEVYHFTDMSELQKKWHASAAGRKIFRTMTQKNRV